MAKSKFSALADLRRQQEAPVAPDSLLSDLEPAGRGRPMGKRSNPDYQPTTVLLRKATKRAATRKLEDRETGQDLSDLIEQLLTSWIEG
ncbi:hypothetical protein [Magnetospirillum molischianum]|nr:hypothetical protein [Magnetospirillum molischianum]